MENVGYLEDSDFDGAHLTITGTVYVMIQANFCGACSAQKPDYQKFANRMRGRKGVMVCSISGDTFDTSGQKKLYDQIHSIFPDHAYYPEYYMFKDGVLHEQLDLSQIIE